MPMVVCWFGYVDILLLNRVKYRGYRVRVRSTGLHWISGISGLIINLVRDSGNKLELHVEPLVWTNMV